jgi:penicillin-binding protein 2
VDARGAIASPLRLERWQRQPAALQLTIDSRVQRAAERALRLGIKLAHAAGYRDADAGAAVVLEARTGAIKALASAPSVDEAAAANDPRYLQRLVAGRVAGTPLFNRATQGLYPAGSTFKPVVAQAALAAHLISPSSELACTGSLQVGNVIFHNVEASINALLTLPQALAVSCDTWFYRLGEDFYWRQLDGQSLIQNWARSLGLGHPTGIDLPAESGGIVPTPRWLRATFPHTPQEQWYEGTSVNLAIGQGYLAITPLQLAVAYAALANGGTVVRPHLARAILRSDGRSRRPLSFPARRRLRLPDLWAIHEGLFAAAHAPTGTSAAVFAQFRIPVAGKTGTAEVPHGSDNSWYASWAPAQHPRFVVVVLIEHGGFGADAAAPAARAIYDALFPLRR